MRIAASAPTRIDLAGGTIDIWPLYLFHDGAATLNAAISLRAQVNVEARGDEGIELRSLDTAREGRARGGSDLDPAARAPLPPLGGAARPLQAPARRRHPPRRAPRRRRHRRIVRPDHRALRGVR